ncbi:MAG TPA: hypothetical protein VI258_10775, partial [Rhodanobacteraceae bacterium]
MRARTSKFDGGFQVIRSAIAALLVAATAAAQQPQQQKQSQSNEPLPKLTETIDVRVINVDVVVTDKKGNPVTGLKQDDFELYENGVPKKITNFYEVEGSKPVTTAANATAAKPAAAAPAPLTANDIPENMHRKVIFYI